MATHSSFETNVSAQHSPWHSPVPYLFGGLAAMLGLIAFALLILACSYWKLSGSFDNEENGERDLENGDQKPSDGIKIPPCLEEKIVVIMAGDEKPTFLATPMSSTASSFGDNNKDKKEMEKETMENQKDEDGSQESRDPQNQ